MFFKCACIIYIYCVFKSIYMYIIKSKVFQSLLLYWEKYPHLIFQRAQIMYINKV